MATVLTTSMTLRIILSVRGSLSYGGTFSVGTTQTSSSRSTHMLTTRSNGPTNNISHAAHTYTLDDIRSKRDGEWPESNTKPAVLSMDGEQPKVREDDESVGGGVKITVDREIGYDSYLKQ